MYRRGKSTSSSDQQKPDARPTPYVVSAGLRVSGSNRSTGRDYPAPGRHTDRGRRRHHPCRRTTTSFSTPGLTFPSLSTRASTRAGTIPARTSADAVSSSFAVKNAKIQAASTRRGSSRGASAVILPLKHATTITPTSTNGAPAVPSPRARFETAHAAVRAISID